MSLRTTDLLAVSLLLAVACVETNSGDGGSTIDYGLCPAPVTDTDGGVDLDAGTDPDAGTVDAGSPVPEGASCDPATGLFWQTVPSPVAMMQAEAADHCTGLELGGISEWRLPTITELRSLVAEQCEATRTGGDCKVSDPDCLTPAICFDLTCAGCPAGEGPGRSGCYLDPALSGECSAYWTTSLQDSLGPASIFWLDFSDAKIELVSDVRGGLARCVHAPELP